MIKCTELQSVKVST